MFEVMSTSKVGICTSCSKYMVRRYNQCTHMPISDPAWRTETMSDDERQRVTMSNEGADKRGRTAPRDGQLLKSDSLQDTKRLPATFLQTKSNCPQAPCGGQLPKKQTQTDRDRQRQTETIRDRERQQHFNKKNLTVRKRPTADSYLRSGKQASKHTTK